MAHTITDRCTGCSACFRQCPTRAISGQLHGMYVIDSLFCIDCGVCGHVCPEDAVFDEVGLLVARIPRDERARPVVAADLCNGCAMCVDVCPVDCLSIAGRTQEGICYLSEPLACISCGECETICIKGAVQMKTLDIRTYDPLEQRSSCEATLATSR